MRSQGLSIRLTGALATLTLFATVTPAAAQRERILHSFGGNSNDGTLPSASLIFDAAGNLYSTTQTGGAYGLGTVFELSHKAGGGWTESVLYTFGGSLKDGNTPYAGVVFGAVGAVGNLYGTTSSGGAYDAGTVFELTPTARGWREKILHNFNPNGTDGTVPYSALIHDTVGNLYGTTYSGGSYGGGTVFELMPKAGGGWIEKVLHSFGSDTTDGFDPYASLIFDATGNLYGTTVFGGAYSGGVAFKLSPTAGGNWIEKTLHSFNSNTGTDGFNPYGGLIFDAVGNLYGTTFYGYAHYHLFYDGTVFELKPTAGGAWTEEILYTFNGHGMSGFYPFGGVMFDAAGNLYGTTYIGDFNGGSVFELNPAVDGGWTENVLHTFGLAIKDGADPHSGLIRDESGVLYGTTYLGGAYNGGTVFEICALAQRSCLP